ncbi:hypothetical protein SLS62_002133 [Diatrype stigma]|uniref:Calcineurin-like phosphoesterase domain-containing protein n=1 Tax=Diatrype stigma TaxID=117547 RepID=A0AAN9UYV0_9PEZI
MERLRKILPRRLRRLASPRIQILSDLHLDIGQQYSSYEFPVSAPFLLLGGDIGRLADYDPYRKFLEKLVGRYERVFLVLGNHEFYGLSYEAGIAQARRLSEEPSLADSLVLLHRTRWDDPGSGLTILGCTLWSDIPNTAEAIFESKINDFKKIDGWTVPKHSQVHAEEADWLRTEVARVAASEPEGDDVSSSSSGSRTRRRHLLVATHYAPCLEGTSRPEQASNPWTPAFATGLVDQGGWDGVNTWVFGHTHHTTALVRNGIKLVSNQRGYIFPGSAARREEELGQQKTKQKKGSYNTFDAAMTIAIC